VPVFMDVERGYVSEGVDVSPVGERWIKVRHIGCEHCDQGFLYWIKTSLVEPLNSDGEDMLAIARAGETS
jgi:hypothetical protein